MLASTVIATVENGARAQLRVDRGGNRTPAECTRVAPARPGALGQAWMAQYQHRQGRWSGGGAHRATATAAMVPSATAATTVPIQGRR